MLIGTLLILSLNFLDIYHNSFLKITLRGPGWLSSSLHRVFILYSVTINNTHQLVIGMTIDEMLDMAAYVCTYIIASKFCEGF